MSAPTPPPQEAFLQNLNLQITPHLTDSSLTIRRLLRLVGMSRTDLHRKLDKAAGMSATAYLRHLRLRQAAIMLARQPEWSIYQIALEVGFTSQSYFTRKFKEQFGVCPLAFREAKKTASKNLEHL